MGLFINNCFLPLLFSAIAKDTSLLPFHPDAEVPYEPAVSMLSNGLPDQGLGSMFHRD